MRGVYRPIEALNGRTYYVRLDVLNMADYIYVDTKNPESDGFGGAYIPFMLEDGTMMEPVKGPWHTNCGALLKETGLDLRELHLTRITLWSVKTETHDRFQSYREDPETGKLEWGYWMKDYLVEDEVIYEELQPVLGIFMRGDRIAHQIADTLGKPIKLRSQSEGGSSIHIIQPHSEMHPMAREEYITA